MMSIALQNFTKQALSKHFVLIERTARSFDKDLSYRRGDADLPSIEAGSIASACSNAHRASCRADVVAGRCHHAQPRIMRSRASGWSLCSRSIWPNSATTSSRFRVCANRLVISSCASSRSRRLVSKRSTHRCEPVSASSSCTFTRTWSPVRRTLPWRTYRTPRSRPICFISAGLPLYVNAVLRAITKLPAIRDRSVVRSSVIASTKYSCSGSLDKFAKGNTTMDSGAVDAGRLAVLGVSVMGGSPPEPPP